MLTARAAMALPDGGFLLATPIIDTEAATPRYIHLQIDGPTITVTYASVFQPDADMCREHNHCDAYWDGLQLRYAQKDNQLRISDRNLTRDDKPSSANRVNGDPTADQRLYFEPLIRRLNNATVVGDAAGGFTLLSETDDAPTRFAPLPREGLDLLMAWVGTAGVSLNRLNYCEVPQFSQIYPLAQSQRFRNALTVFNEIRESSFAATRLVTQEDESDLEWQDRSAKQKQRSRPANILNQTINWVIRHPQDDPAEVMDRLLGPSAPSEVSVHVIPMLPYIKDAADFKARLQKIRDAGTPLSAPLCMDMTLGMGKTHPHLSKGK
ncbi:hypothetical protein ERN12_09985 [Rhodobacteraceae bacterium]|nr:hypothetical protein ERN12_09985 [Paracoccaceae bacterium]